jgi:hypothetical protein
MPRSSRRSKDERPRGSARTRDSRLDDDEDDDEDGEDFDNSSTVAGLEARYGSARAALAQVHSERVRESRKRKRLRTALDEAQAELEDLREQIGVAPNAEIPEKAVLLTAEDKAELDSYRELGKLAEVKKMVGEYPALRQKADDAEAMSSRQKAAQLAGGWDHEVLADLLKVTEMDLEFKTEKVDGKDVEVPYVKAKTEGAKPTRLVEFVESNDKAKKYLPALAKEGAAEDAGDTTLPLMRRGSLYAPRVPASSKPEKQDVVGTTLANRDFRPSKARAGADSNRTG